MILHLSFEGEMTLGDRRYRVAFTDVPLEAEEIVPWPVERRSADEAFADYVRAREPVGAVA